MDDSVQVLTLADISGDTLHRKSQHKRKEKKLKIKAPPNLNTNTIVGRLNRTRIVRDVESNPRKVSLVRRNTLKRSSTAPAEVYPLNLENVELKDAADTTQRMLDEVYLANIYGESGEDTHGKDHVGDDHLDDVESIFEAPLDFVMQTVNINRMQRLADIAVGINPGEYKSLKKRGKKARRAEQTITFSGTPQVDQLHSREEKTTNKPHARAEHRAWFPFPKERDFISPESKRIDSAGVDWTIRNVDELYVPHTTRQRKQVTIQMSLPTSNHAAPAHKNTIPGRLCRLNCPVTEALNREGTSLTKQKGKTLQPGEHSVMKVWERRLSNVHLLSPMQMAKEDIRSVDIKLPENGKQQIPKLFARKDFREGLLQRGYTI